MLGMVQEHLLHFNHKPLLVKPSHKCKVKIAKVQEAAMSLEINIMLPKRTVELGWRTKGLSLIPLSSPRKN